MAYVVPNTTCNLYSGVEAVPGLQNLYFSNATNKASYFAGKLAYSHVNMTYQRKGLGRLRIEESIAHVRACNYITFVNGNHENVTFYAFIFDYEYINENCTEVSFVIDEWLTNCHNANMTFEDCVIEREHNNLAEYNAERANPYRNDMPSLKADEPMTVGKLDELPTVLPIVNIMESGAGLDSEYSYTYSGPFSRLSDTTDYPDGQNMCYVVLFGGQLSAEESKAVVRCADYMHAPSDYTKNTSNYDRYYNQIPEIFKMFTDFDVPRLRDNVVSPFYIGIYDMVNGTSEDSDGHFKGSDIVDILNWFTLNDAVNTIIGIYMLPRYMCSWDYQVKTTSDSVSTEYTISKNGKGCYVSSGLNASLPEVINSQYLMGDSDDDSPYNIYMPLPTVQVENYKLKRFPYSYIRAVAPDETTKEFYYEEFFDIANANSVDFTKNASGQPNSKPAKFRCVTNLNGQPTLSLVPHNYKLKGTIPNGGGIIGLLSSDLYGLNGGEKLEFSRYPQLGFMSDGYVSYLAAQYNDANERKSVEAQAAYNHNLISQRLGNAKEMAGNVGDIVSGYNQIGTINSSGQSQTGSGIAQMARGIVNMPSTIENMRYTEEANQIYKQRMAEADMRGQFNGQIYDTLYNGTKPTFVGDSYVKGDTFGYGMYQFFNINAGVIGFTVQVVELKPSVLALYDNFLTNYGYAVNRIGLPHVYEALKGMTDKTLKFNSKNFVYVKTSECKVKGLIYESCKQIEDMFNNGIKFINGDPVQSR